MAFRHGEGTDRVVRVIWGEDQPLFHAGPIQWEPINKGLNEEQRQVGLLSVLAGVVGG